MKNKQTSTEYLFEKLWHEPKDKFSWNYYLAEAKEIEKSNLLRYGFKYYMFGVLSAWVGILISKFI